MHATPTDAAIEGVLLLNLFVPPGNQYEPYHYSCMTGCPSSDTGEDSSTGNTLCRM